MRKQQVCYRKIRSTSSARRSNIHGSTGPTLPENNKVPANQPFTVVVTGAGKGLGRALSISYAKAGVTGIVISSRTKSDLDSLAEELKQINPSINVVIQTCDTGSAEQVAELAKVTANAFSAHLDVVVANAGIISKYIENSVNPATGKTTSRRLPVGIIEDEDFARVTTTNYLGTYYTAKYFTPLLLAKENSSPIRAFIGMTSIAGLFPSSTFTPVAYNVSKIAINRIVEHLVNDHGEQGLQAFALHPGEVVTPQTEGHILEKGDMWESLLQTDIGLVGGFCTWLTREPRKWLSGRYLSVHWDVDELEAKKDEIVEGDKLKFRLHV